MAGFLPIFQLAIFFQTEPKTILVTMAILKGGWKIICFPMATILIAKGKRGCDQCGDKDTVCLFSNPQIRNDFSQAEYIVKR